jgi:phage repressor protein C with HTH and peptisase S24 domain
MVVNDQLLCECEASAIWLSTNVRRAHMSQKLSELLASARQAAIQSGRTDASMEDVAFAAGMSKAAYAKLENGKTKSTTRWRELADHLGISHDDFIKAMPSVSPAGGASPRVSRGVRLMQRPDGTYIGGAPGMADNRTRMPSMSPVLGHAAAGAHGYVIIGDPIAYEPTPPELENAQEGYLLYVSGESMVPRFFPGERISVHPGRPYSRNDFVVVQFDDGSPEHVGMVKQFQGYDDETGDLLLSQYNPATEIRVPGDKVREIHRVVIPGL